MRNSREPGRGKPSRDTSFERRPQRAHIRKSDDAAYREAGGYENVVAGRNAVIEALKAGGRADTVYLQKGASGGSIGKIIALAKEGGYPVKEVSAEKLDAMAGPAHQGVALTLSAAAYAELEDILARAEEKGEKPFILIADEIEDPHNLGALIRTAEAAGAHGVVIPKRRGVGLTAAVFKTSAGAAAHLPVARVANLASAVDRLKQAGVWIYGADMEGDNWCSVDFSGGVGLIIGSEGNGIGKLLREKCDQMVSLPMRGEVNSLNASVAGGILLYEIARQRLGIPAVTPGR